MSIFSEVEAKLQSEKLEEILNTALKSNNEGVLNFCKDHIYPLYLDAIAESWGLVVENENLRLNFTRSNS